MLLQAEELRRSGLAKARQLEQVEEAKGALERELKKVRELPPWRRNEL